MPRSNSLTTLAAEAKRKAVERAVKRLGSHAAAARHFRVSRQSIGQILKP